jgi:valyl-tRNA synthetase
MVNWDPGLGSAISDLEVEDREVTDTLYYVDYPLASGTGALTVATVRPETMLADTAIAVNPGDERYQRLIGETAVLPLVGRKLKIVADEYVKPEFGTGAVKITPGHDPNDFEIGRRHGLELITVIGEDGRITDAAPERFQGLTVEKASRAVVDELREQGLIARTEEYPHTVPFSQRSGQRIEPLVSLQWFMRMDELARPAIEAVKDGRVRFYPERWTRVYLDWMENIRPWTISRQLWWGHQIPVWYRGSETYVGEAPPGGRGWQRDPDVLDTWFSSSLWPFVTLGWPSDTPELRAFYPTDSLSTARDIIFLWVARMIMMGLEFTGQAPFSDVPIHSIIQAPDGRRMSKSLGTGIDPMDLINGGLRPPVFKEGGSFPPYGADAVRWGLLAMASGQDVRFSEEKLAQGQQLTNKLWNASRLVLLGVGSDARAALTPTRVEDRWILSRLERARRALADRIESYELAHAAHRLYDFVFGELCDWYLELVKPRLRSSDPELAGTLLYVLTETLVLAHPMIPFVTEEIYSHVPGTEGLLAARATGPASPIDEAAEQTMARVIEAVTALRAWRDAAGVKVGVRVPARLAATGYEETAQHIAALGRLSLSEDGAAPVDSIPVPGGAIEILAGEALDPEAAARKRAAERDRLSQEINRAQSKLSNQGFVAKAPERVVQAERDKLERLKTELEALDVGS